MLIVDERAAGDLSNQESYLPKYLLQKEVYYCCFSVSLRLSIVFNIFTGWFYHNFVFCMISQGGFEFYDPHIPIHVPHYSDKEIHSCLNYYIENQWIQNPHGKTDAGKQELIFMSCKNPFELLKVTRTW